MIHAVRAAMPWAACAKPRKLNAMAGRSPLMSSASALPSSEGQVHAVAAGWGAGVLPQLLVRQQLASGEFVDLAPGHALPIALYWDCWNLESQVLDTLTQALSAGAAQALA